MSGISGSGAIPAMGGMGGTGTSTSLSKTRTWSRPSASVADSFWGAHLDGHRAADRSLSHHAGELGRAQDGLALVAEDHVSLLDPGRLRGAPLHDPLDEGPALVAQLQARDVVFLDLREAHPEPAPRVSDYDPLLDPLLGLVGLHPRRSRHQAGPEQGRSPQDRRNPPCH
jgi:hypothetical protein